jgi:hypothetical protein
MANEQNLRPQSMRTKSEQREIGRKGGIASGVARREKKLMSELYADFIAEKHKVKIGRKVEELTGYEYFALVITEVLTRGGGAAVSMLREIREATEGSRVKTENSIDINYDDPKIQELLKKYGVRRPN